MWYTVNHMKSKQKIQDWWSTNPFWTNKNADQPQLFNKIKYHLSFTS